MTNHSASTLLALFFLAAQLCAAGGEVYRIRGVAGLPAKTKIELARSAEPIWHTTNFGGQTLGEILMETCGEQGISASAFLQRETVRMNGAGSLDAVVGPGMDVAIPFCLKIDEKVPITIQDGDTLEDLLKLHYGVFGPRTLDIVYQLNKEAYPSSPDIDHFARHLQPGQEIVLPYSAEARLFVQRESTEEQTADPSSEAKPLPVIVGNLPYSTLAAPLRTNLTRLDEIPEIPKRDFEYVKFVTSSNAAATPSCGLEPGDAAQPIFNLELLTLRLSKELEQLGSSRAPVVVGIVDTGIGTIGDGFFDKGLFKVNQFEEQGKPGRDDDRPENSFVDDIFGINLNGGLSHGRIQYYPADPDRSHGTKVATLVLGGVDFPKRPPGTNIPWIQLKIVNFSSATRPGPVEPTQLPQAIKYLADQGADVVNLSLRNTRPLYGLLESMRQAQDTLFVVAAGNAEIGAGKDLAITRVYPARFGGRAGHAKSTTITVGSHSGLGEWARFSNYSRDFVDLLAPGCSVPTRDIDGSIVAEHGTSVSSAIVSFVAGLVSGLGEHKPVNIKNRLLISTDVDERLHKHAWSSGRLNAVKAISLRHDVIETFSESGRYLFGRLDDPESLRRFCGDAELRSDLTRIRRIRPNVGGSNIIEYWIETDGVLGIAKCTQSHSDQPVGRIHAGDEWIPGPPLKEVRDLVLASF